MVRIVHILQLVLTITIAAMIVSACNSNASQTFSHPTGIASSTECRIIQHDAGETNICNQPQKIAVLSQYTLDMMLSLGVQPAGFADYWSRSLTRFDHPTQQIPYLGSRITTQPINLGRVGNPSLEILTALKPDLILTEYRNQYELLSTIAPTVYVEYNKGGWKRDIYTIAKALDRESQVQQVLAKHEQQLRATQTKLAPVLATHSRLLLVNVRNLGTPVDLFYKDPPATLLDNLGFRLVKPESMEKRTRRKISIEILPQLETDIIIVSRYKFDSKSVWNNNSYDVPLDNFEREWNLIPLLKNLKANHEGCVYFVDGVLWGGTIRGPIADEIVMQQLPEILLPACRR
ncbi:iron-siderophore ABC transporter substrate-binding protein [Chlorogloeopsis sp. ULAP01]|uniref:ABC transporter substrate-binding protein n=1 Tax=Chlorogloeopsis sp. ULAP01 TaxID=3056483 RepID=UPI0025AB0F8C|nr:iron-siderophore ABC transporter substrate-binding protein [Chlorogloeopsis sp. ULAP01]MDM9383744.1 iron-siderophore ABC transporter substrate-binding protein [Chlorogloeopsis sp. ULAP01]